METEFEFRAVQLDLARQMETVDFIKEFIDFIAKNHYNVLFLYLEWRVRTKSCDLGEGNGYTAAEMRNIVEYAAARGVDVVPGLAVLGHAEALIERRPQLNELRNGVKGRFGSSYSHDLCPTSPEVRELLENYLAEVAEIFPSRYIHVGGDEVFSIGFCDRCAPKAEDYAGEQALYLEHFKFCRHIVTGKLGRRMMMWDDMFELYPDALAGLPRDIILVNWQYQENVTGYRGHFTNLEFRDRLAEYRNLGFEFIIGPADYSWGNVASSTNNAESKQCFGGLLTLWEKRCTLIYKYYPIIAATGRLWGGSRDGSEKILDDTLAELFGIDHPVFINVIKQYIEQTERRVGITPLMLTSHSFFGPDRKYLLALRTMAEVIAEFRPKLAGSPADMIADDILCNILDLSARERARTAAFKMLHGQDAEALDAIVADIMSVSEMRIKNCERARGRRDAAHFTEERDNSVEAIRKFEAQIQTRAFATVLFCLPDAYGAERVTVKLRSGSEWREIGSGVMKELKSALYKVSFFIPEDFIPEEAEITARGFAGQGVCYISAKTPKGEFIPFGITAAAGMVEHPEHILTADANFCYMGFQHTLDLFKDRAKANVENMVRIALRRK